MINVATNEFDAQVLKSELPVLVDFWADWCGPCKMLAPTLEALSKEVEGKAKVVKVNVDEARELAEQYEISSIPTLLVFDKGEMVDRRSGVMNINQLKALIGIKA